MPENHMFEYNGFRVSNSCVKMKVATFGAAGAASVGVGGTEVAVGGTDVAVGGTAVSVGFTTVGLSVGFSIGFSVGTTATVSVDFGAAGAEVDVAFSFGAHALKTRAATVKRIINL